MKILVTGAAGYIGSHVVHALSKLGFEITAVDNNWEQNDISSYIKRSVNWDIRFKNRQIKDEFNAVIHLAALTTATRSIAEPLLFYRANLLGTYNILSCIKTNHFIYCSTGAVHSVDSSPYVLSKRSAEDLVSVLPNYSICRLYNVTGSIGFKKFNDEDNLLKKAALASKGQIPVLSVFGNNYTTRDGTTIRNYTHINDVVQSIVNIVKNGPTKSIENLGNLTGHTVLEVISEMKKLSGVDFPIEFLPKRIGDYSTSILESQSKFFLEQQTLSDQCLSVLNVEKSYTSPSKPTVNTQSQKQSS